MKLSEIVAAIERLHPRWSAQKIGERAALVEQVVSEVERAQRIKANVKASPPPPDTINCRCVTKPVVDGRTIFPNQPVGIVKEAYEYLKLRPDEIKGLTDPLINGVYGKLAVDRSPHYLRPGAYVGKIASPFISVLTGMERPNGVTDTEWQKQLEKRFGVHDAALIRAGKIPTETIPCPTDSLKRLAVSPAFFLPESMSSIPVMGAQTSIWTSKAGIAECDMFDIEWKTRPGVVRIFGWTVHPDSYEDMKWWRRVTVSDAWSSADHMPAWFAGWDPTAPCLILNSNAVYVYGRLGSIAFGSDLAFKVVIDK